MEHQEAIEMMASERYLLDELTPELRDAYEEHYFGCAECALDVQLGAAFIDQTKIVLPEMMFSAAPASPAASAPAARVTACDWPEVKPVKQKRDWFAWLRPAMSLRPALLAPAFACVSACLLALTGYVGYQDLVVYPALQAAAIEPRILPVATILHDETRGGIPVIHADLRLGTTITVELPSGASYSAYRLECYDSKGKLIWTRNTPGNVRSSDVQTSDVQSDDTLSFWLSGSVKQDTYKLVIGGVTPDGQIVQVKQQIFDLQVKK